MSYSCTNMQVLQEGSTVTCDIHIDQWRQLCSICLVPEATVCLGQQFSALLTQNLRQRRTALLAPKITLLTL